MLPSVLVELLLGLAGEGALGAGVGTLPSMVHYVLFQLNDNDDNDNSVNDYDNGPIG